MFLDRDGTLTQPRHYPTHPDELVLQPNIGVPLRALQDRGFALVIATNQSGLARGLFDAAVLDAMHTRLRTLLGRHEVRLDGIYACPHHPNGIVPQYRVSCSCRKPAPGMLHRAAQDLELDLTQSWIVGDSACDMRAGHRAGTRTAFVGPQPFGDVHPDVQGTATSDVLCQVLRSSFGVA